MPKIKSSRMARKKYRISASGKVKRSQAFKRHNTAKRGPKRRRQLSAVIPVSSVDEKAVRRLLPGSKKNKRKSS